MKKNDLTFEEKLDALENIIEIMDKGELPLDTMLKKYEDGIMLINELREYLEKAELKIIEIDKKNNPSSEDSL